MLKKFVVALLLAVSWAPAWSQTSGIPAGLVLIQRQAVAGVATVDFTVGINSRFDEYVLKISGAQVSGGTAFGLIARVSEDAGSTWKAGASDYVHNQFVQMDNGTPAAIVGGTVAGAFATSMVMIIDGSPGLGIGVGALSGEIRFSLPSSSAFVKQFMGEFFLYTPVPPGVSTHLSHAFASGAYRGTTNPITGVRLLASAGNLTGTFTLYGVRRN